MAIEAGPHRHTFVVNAEPPGGQGGWWASVVSDDGPLGVVIIVGHVDEPVEVAVMINEIVPGTNGEVALIPYPTDMLTYLAPSDTGRLLDDADLARIGENNKTMNELGLEW